MQAAAQTLAPRYGLTMPGLGMKSPLYNPAWLMPPVGYPQLPGSTGAASLGGFSSSSPGGTYTAGVATTPSGKNSSSSSGYTHIDGQLVPNNAVRQFNRTLSQTNQAALNKLNQISDAGAKISQHSSGTTAE
jgi:hypothetical protein